MSGRNEDLAYLTLAEAANRLRRRELSPVELARAAIDRIERLDPRINAFLRFTPEAALDAAKAAEGEIAAGDYRGPVARCPLCAQGHHRLRRAADDGAFEDPGRQHRRRGRLCRPPAAAGGRRPSGQTLDPRIRDRRPLLRPALAAGAQPVEPRAFPRRLVERVGCRACRRVLCRGARHRYRRLGAQPSLDVRHRRA